MHDCGGRLLETVDVPRGLVWRRVYDAVGRILYSSECGEASLSGDKSPDDISFSGGYVFRYDNLGRMVGKEYVVGSVVRRLHGRDGYVNALLVRGIAWSSGERYDLGGRWLSGRLTVARFSSMAMVQGEVRAWKMGMGIVMIFLMGWGM